MKRCSICRQELPLTSFHKNPKTKDKRQSRCITCQAIYYKEYRTLHAEHLHLKAKIKYAKTFLQRQAYLKANKDKRAKSKKAWHLAHRAHVAQYRKTYRATHTEQERSYGIAPKARIRNAPIVEKISPMEIFERDQWICNICHKKVKRNEASLDHVIPVSKGGTHTYKNLVLAHLYCNISKGNRVKTQQMRLF